MEIKKNNKEIETEEFYIGYYSNLIRIENKKDKIYRMFSPDQLTRELGLVRKRTDGE